MAQRKNPTAATKPQFARPTHGTVGGFKMGGQRVASPTAAAKRVPVMPGFGARDARFSSLSRLPGVATTHWVPHNRSPGGELRNGY
ncbi:MAG: hypothetical protein R3B96_24310 [Pirellulaceae bacterium]